MLKKQLIIPISIAVAMLFTTGCEKQVVISPASSPDVQAQSSIELDGEQWTKLTVHASRLEETLTLEIVEGGGRTMTILVYDEELRAGKYPVSYEAAFDKKIGKSGIRMLDAVEFVGKNGLVEISDVSKDGQSFSVNFYSAMENIQVGGEREFTNGNLKDIELK